MRLNLLYPSNWTDFQDLCFQLWKEMWRDPDAHPNGRNGQAQNGVDIWGKNMFDNDYSGVQCKWKIQCKLPPKTKRFCPLVLK